MDMISGATSNTVPSALHHKQEAAARDGDGVRKPRPHQNEALECPRCHSTNTKFFYYNNNTVTQPRYLCKACRRYWTHGGSLRNVPVGGSSRKNKKNNHALASGSSSSASSSSSSRSKINFTQMMMMPMMPTATTSTTVTDYPNVLPTFMSNGGGGGMDSNYGSNGIGMTVPFSLPSLGAMLMNGHGMMGSSTDQHATTQAAKEGKPRAGGDGGLQFQ